MWNNLCSRIKFANRLHVQFFVLSSVIEHHNFRRTVGSPISVLCCHLSFTHWSKVTPVVYIQGSCHWFCLYLYQRIRWDSVSRNNQKSLQLSMLQDICDHVTVAREMIALGNYDAAKTYYEITLQTIVDLIVTILDPVRRNNWQQVRTHIYTFVRRKITETAAKL